LNEQLEVTIRHEELKRKYEDQTLKKRMREKFKKIKLKDRRVEVIKK